MEPNVAFPSSDTPVAFFPQEAWVDAPQLTKALVESARQNGAQPRFGAAVEGIESRDGRVAGVRLRNGERLEVDGVVNAAGPGADRVAALLDRTLPLDLTKGLLLRLSVEGTPLQRILHSPRIHLRPDGPEHILTHHRSIDEKLESTTESASLHRELLGRARVVVPALESAEVEGAQIGVRPMPKDGFPCVGAVSAIPGYYEVVTHSGITLGPLLGRLLAREVLSGELDPLLAPFSPDRFARG
jgi:glycine/D-amino acid oxidase-like deaminating enzyme